MELDTMKRRRGGGAAAKRKGARGELKARKRLEAQGYHVIKAGGSLGCFDLVALGAAGVRCVQVKCNGYASTAERAAMAAVALPANCSREIWRWIDYEREPRIEGL